MFNGFRTCDSDSKMVEKSPRGKKDGAWRSWYPEAEADLEKNIVL